MSSDTPAIGGGTPRAVLSHAVAWTLITACMFLLAEALLFRLPWYYKYLEPNSSTGRVELEMYWLRRFRPTNLQEVIVMGDSRIAEGFSARQATALATDENLYFWNAGIGATSPRVWYYILRDADPHRSRFRAIILALDHYTEQDSFDSPTDRLIDVNMVVGRLRLSDSWDFASSMVTPKTKRAALVAALLKGNVLRRDLNEFLGNIPDRLARSRDWRQHGLDYILGYGGREENLLGLSADWHTRQLFYPPGLDAQRRSSVKDMLMPDVPPQTGELSRYRMRWLGRILDLYRESPTRIIFIEMPRGPLPQPPQAASTSFIDWARRQSSVSVVDPATFRHLETSETFCDGLHLNRAGRAAFTQQLTPIVERLSKH